MKLGLEAERCDPEAPWTRRGLWLHVCGGDLCPQTGRLCWRTPEGLGNIAAASMSISSGLRQGTELTPCGCSQTAPRARDRGCGQDRAGVPKPGVPPGTNAP